MEKYFEWEQCAKVGCQRYCSFCLSEVPNFTKRVDRDGVVSVLIEKVHSTPKGVSVSNFVKAMKSSKDAIFHPKDVPKKSMGQIHALALQMFANGIIALDVKDTAKIGTDKLLLEHMSIKLPTGTQMRRGNAQRLPAFMMDKFWDGINTYAVSDDVE